MISTRTRLCKVVKNGNWSLQPRHCSVSRDHSTCSTSELTNIQFFRIIFLEYQGNFSLFTSSFANPDAAAATCLLRLWLMRNEFQLKSSRSVSAIAWFDTLSFDLQQQQIFKSPAAKKISLLLLLNMNFFLFRSSRLRHSAWNLLSSTSITN